MGLKGLVFVLNKANFLLVRLIYEKQMLEIITKNYKYNNSILLLTF